MATTSLLDTLEIFADAHTLVAVAAAPPPVVPESIIAEARAEAARIVAAAHASAETIIADATEQAVALREAAWQEGHHEGMVTARQEVEVQMRAESEEYRTAMRDELQEIVDSIAAGRQDLWQRQETDMLAFIVDISRQVIKTEVQQNPEVLMEIVRNAMRRVTDKDNMRLRVSSHDAPRVKAAREEIMQIVDGVRNLEIVDDRRIGPGGCVIETNAGTIDAKIETQLGEIERVLSENDAE